jgi:hypothetical protein
LRGLVRHRYALGHAAKRRKNTLTAICDERFPAFADLFKDPNAVGALALREAFATPHAVAPAAMADLLTADAARRLPSLRGQAAPGAGGGRDEHRYA